MVRKLILKEWHFGRDFAVGAIGLGVLVLIIEAAFIRSTNPVVRVVTVVLFYGVLNALIWLPVTGVVRERTEQTLAFVMSLPVTIREYTAAKILSQLIVFLVPWFVLGSSAILFIASSDAIPNGYIPLTLIVLTQLLALFCVVLCVSLVGESPILAQSVGIASNLVFWLSFGFIGVAPGFGLDQDPEAVWNSPVSHMLAGQLALVPVLLGLTFWLQSRKTDFL
jgi:hypothetical protein